MEQKISLKKIDNVAKLWEKTKDPKYKAEWYKLIKEWANGADYFKRRNVSINSVVKADDGTCVFIGKSKLL